ncbi:MAG: hypothetical protein IJH53_03205 [Oscillospiraceae bacterium]|nr:hypothetical protein [Oscillospiraceae bacterium]
MDFRSTKVKDFFADERKAAIVKELAPNLLKYPIKLFNSKTCGEIFDLVVKKKIVPEEAAKEIERRVNAL